MQIPNDLIETLLIESATFRKFCADLLSGQESPDAAWAGVKAECQRLLGGGAKIEAIKYLRQATHDNKSLCDYLKRFYRCDSEFDTKGLGLGSAKRIVETL